jgi:hypothetical protein
MGPGIFIEFAWGVGGIILGYIGGMVINRPDGSSGNYLRTIAGLIILIVVALGAVLNYQNSVALHQSVTCQRQFNQNYRDSLQAQLDASGLEAQSQRDFISVFRGGQPNAAVRDKTFDTYLQKLADAEALRQSHRLPVNNPCGPS